MKRTINLLVVFLLLAAISGVTGAELPPLKAKWIWAAKADPQAYNQTVIAKRIFRLKAPGSATLRISADSFYRLSINGTWVNDGPSRAWPEHYQYDVLPVTAYLKAGENEIEIVARYYGVGDFHRVPQSAGLLVQLDVEDAGRPVSILTDKKWRVAEATAWKRETPKVSIQMEPAELFDARLAEQLKFHAAIERFGAQDGPWKDLHARDVALLTKEPRPFRAYLGAQIVQARGRNFCLPAVRLSLPGVIEANHNASAACGMATVVANDSPTTLVMKTEAMRVSVDGKQAKDNRFTLAPGRHVVLAFPSSLFGHEKEKALRIIEPDNLTLENPLKPGFENPFVLVRLPECVIATNDFAWRQFRGEVAPLDAAMDAFQRLTEQLTKAAETPEDFLTTVKDRLELRASEKMFVEDVHWQFTDRKVVKPGDALVQNGPALLHDTPEVTIIQPTTDGDVELLYDLGEQDVGYYQFEVISEPDVLIDIFGIEYISPEGQLQHSQRNRNGMRYITREGVNRFTSLKRRSGRYIFVTIRNHQSPVQIRKLQLVSSTYPVDQKGSFTCSDARLDRIWDISTRTLKLCMEDTYTDCPLYEQTHWVGDARNESLLGYSVFGAYDLAKRCARITAHSLERFPIAGCQTPSTWDTLLPAWSFLWGISIWDNYFETADGAFLAEMYPYTIKNLRGAESLTNDQGLFSAPFWNMFDWTGSDQNVRTVVHNSMFVVGAIDAALQSAEVLGKKDDVEWLNAYRARLISGVNRLWDSNKKAYPDSVHDDGKISPSTSQHTSILGLLYGIVPSENTEAARSNLTQPPEKMVRLGSPFAALYLYEAYEKLGMEEEIVKDIYRNYLPMLEAGATTVWESFPTGTTGGGRWPTRSHCHAWSSAPSRFLNRIVLGVKVTSPGATQVELSPRLSGLTWASGVTLTKAGPVDVSWKISDQQVRIDYRAPEGVRVQFKRNPSMDGFEVVLNGQKQS